MTIALENPRQFSDKTRNLAWFIALLPALLALQSVAQTPAGFNPLNRATTLSHTFQTATAESEDASQCRVHVTANEVIVSDHEREEIGYNVLPPGIIPDPGAWPYFAWSDTSLGVVRTSDGSGYLFFGSDGGCHMDCSGTDQRGGSITVSQGTLDHPLGEPLGNPNPPVYEFAFPVTANLPAYIDYAGGGPVYRVPPGEPGAGSLLLVYHIEHPANPFYSYTGIARSTDEGISWQDLGLILSVPHPYDPTGASDVGENPLVPYSDPTTQTKYFYIFFRSIVGPPLPSAATSPSFRWLAHRMKSFSPPHRWATPSPASSTSTTTESGINPASAVSPPKLFPA